MKLMKRSGIYQGSKYKVTFNPKTLEAYSYRWWKFVARIEGKVVFNNYRYSVSTSKHQRKVEGLLSQLGVKVDLYLQLPQGIVGDDLAELIVTAEETLCDMWLNEQVKKQERYQRAKFRKLKRKLEDYLENQVNFRDYEIRDRAHFGTYTGYVSEQSTCHQCVDSDSLEKDVENALHSFQRDGFSRVVFYVGAI